MTASGIEYILSPEFQQDVAKQIKRWDKEWVRYLHMLERFYFYNMNSDNYALSVRKDDIAAMTEEEIFSTPLMKDQELSCLAIWVPGNLLVDKTVAELGCGPGLLGKLVSRVSQRYVGIDYSKFALYLAKLVSPKNCDYYCLDEADNLKSLN
jgi:SAM-dependent methyltransferase